MKKVLLLSSLIFSTASFAQNDSIVIARLAREIMLNSQAYENLRALCKKIGPRLTGSPQADKAVTETMQMFKAAGADTVYLQPCKVPVWQRGNIESVEITMATKSRRLRSTTLGSSVSTFGQVKGEIVEVKDENDFRSKSASLKNKIVFFNIRMDPVLVNTFEAYGNAGFGRRFGATEAARYGAAGVIVRSLASNIDDHPHTGGLWYNDSFPKIPALAISTSDAEWLSRELKTKKASGSIQTSSSFASEKISYNVIAEIRGSVAPADIITIGAHLDSWDLAEGAHDDGAGCVQMIEVIRAFQAIHQRPKRTVRAVLFMNEENGGRGALAYRDSVRNKNEKIIFALESDAGGFSPRGLSMDMTLNQSMKIKSWRQFFVPYGLYNFFDGHGGADISPLKPLGVALAAFAPDSQRYFDLHHAETDVFESVNQRELNLSAVNIAALTWMISQYGL